MKIAINNLQSEVESSPELETTIRQVLSIGAAELELAEAEVSLALVDDAYIKDLNLKFRAKEEATDVLSFPQNEADGLLGDIIISVERAVEQAADYNHSLAREIGFLAVHGLLHLVGYDHHQMDERERMRQQEEKILAAADLER